MASKAKAQAKEEAAGEGCRRRPRYAAAVARSHRRRRQEDDQGRQEARLRHARPDQRSDAVGRGVLRPDRGHLRDALRNGHQRRRERGRRQRRRREERRRGRRRRRATGHEVVETKSKSLATTEKKEPSERTDDPVRMYLREMGSVELLSREGEIAIAKRIEAGREAMIAGLCESPLTFQAIIIWRDELNEGKVFLRDIIDLEATYAGPDAKNVQTPPAHRPRRQADQWRAVGTPVPGAPHLQVVHTPAPPRAAPAGPTPFKPARRETARRGEGSGRDRRRERLRRRRHGGSLSLAAIEAELKPKVLETFDTIADSFKKLRRLQDQDIELRLKSDSLSPSQERKYKKLKDEIVTEVKSLRLNQARIDSLVEQLYDINKRLVSNEGRLMRLGRVLRRRARGLPAAPTWAPSSIRAGSTACRSCRRRAGRTSSAPRRTASRTSAACARPRRADRRRDRRIPQDRADGAEGRARSAPGQEGNGGGEPAPRHLHRQEIHAIAACSSST